MYGTQTLPVYSSLQISTSVQVLIKETVQILVSIIQVATTAAVHRLALFYDVTENHAFVCQYPCCVVF